MLGPNFNLTNSQIKGGVVGVCTDVNPRVVPIHLGDAVLFNEWNPPPPPMNLNSCRFTPVRVCFVMIICFCTFFLTAPERSGFTDASCSHQRSTSPSCRTSWKSSTNRVSYWSKIWNNLQISQTPWMFSHTSHAAYSISYAVSFTHEEDSYLQWHLIIILISRKLLKDTNMVYTPTIYGYK